MTNRAVARDDEKPLGALVVFLGVNLAVLRSIMVVYDNESSKR